VIDETLNAKAFGEKLKHSRQQQQLTLEQIADTTKIGIHQLRVLERGDIHLLPAGIYRRAIIRQYATAVGLEPEPALRELASSLRDGEDEPVEAQDDAGSIGFPTALWTGAVAVCIAGVMMAALMAGWSQTADSTDASLLQTSSSTPIGAPDITRASLNEETVDEATDIDLPAAPSVPEDDLASPATEGELRITTVPEGAQVTVNGIPWDVTPVTVRYLPFGEQQIRVTKIGYTGQNRSVEITAERPARSIRIRLDPVDEP
jgi:cytoskeletal protein RodZ